MYEAENPAAVPLNSPASPASRAGLSSPVSPVSLVSTVSPLSTVSPVSTVSLAGPASTVGPANPASPISVTLVDQLTAELSQAAGSHGLQAAAGLFTWARAANALRRGNWVEANNDAQQWMEGTANLDALAAAPHQDVSGSVPSRASGSVTSPRSGLSVGSDTLVGLEAKRKWDPPASEGPDALSATRVFSQAVAAYTAAAIGDGPRATTLAETVLSSHVASQFPEISAWCWAALGSLAYAQGNTAQALDHLGRVAEVAAEVANGDCITEPTRLYWEGDWIDALIDSARIEEATVAVAKLRAYAERTGDLWSMGVVARGVGRMEPSAVRAEEQFHHAMTAFEQGGLGFEIARTFCIRGAHFRGEKASASFDIAEGFRRLQRIGATEWANWSVGLLKLTGPNSASLRAPSVSPFPTGKPDRGLLRSESETLRNDDGPFPKERPRNQAAVSPAINEKAPPAVLPGTLRSSTELPLQLTPCELRVASLITTGSTYKEIAGALFISAKTVDFHVQAMYRKAKVKNRVEFVSSFLRMAHA
jgi:DNA-binding CsgD family transcriptional regulator